MTLRRLDGNSSLRKELTCILRFTLDEEAGEGAGYCSITDLLHFGHEGIVD
jgi:hypothetical protein